ncbi:alpha/beta hydrolase [Glaciihabitans sp. UYNi722]|uniref:alpha/beta hydrolase n=1 Tax=Glaciihabitans sp. UYNi722 TaxID=3156344 RepID=UPI00339403E2
MASLASRLMPVVMTARGSKKRFSSVDATLANLKQLQSRPASSAPPSQINKIVDVSLHTVNGWMVYKISPRDITAPRRALYLHGGCYVYEIALQHWLLIAKLAVSTSATFVVPIYPLAPTETASSIVPRVTEMAAELIDEVGADLVSILGDSAGGGMALAVAMQLRDRGLPALHQTVLISPWLDISGTDPALAAIAPRDPWLAIPGTHAVGAIYRGELAENDPIVSPIYGDLTGLGPITMFSGTRDILNADARRFARKARDAGLSLDYHQLPGMIHVYPLLPIPEATEAQRIITRAMTRRN